MSRDRLRASSKWTQLSIFSLKAMSRRYRPCRQPKVYTVGNRFETVGVGIKNEEDMVELDTVKLKDSFRDGVARAAASFLLCCNDVAQQTHASSFFYRLLGLTVCMINNCWSGVQFIPLSNRDKILPPFPEQCWDFHHSPITRQP